MRYIEKADEAVGCIFCVKPAEDRDEENLILYRGERVFTMMNAFPYSNGHLMVSPYQHTANLDDLSDAEMLDLMDATRRGVNLLKAAFKPDGFNIGVNMGRVAGAGIADHVHIHIVPRWSGDTNFMPVLGDVRVIPESLEAVYHRLRDVMTEDGGRRTDAEVEHRKRGEGDSGCITPSLHHSSAPSVSRHPSSVSPEGHSE